MDSKNEFPRRLNPLKRARITNLENNIQNAEIFKLNVDCFEELFDFLSAKDVFSLSRTCKRLHKLISYFFHFTVDISIIPREISFSRNLITTNGWRQNIKFTYIKPNDSEDCLKLIHFFANYDSVRKLSIKHIDLNALRIKKTDIQKILQKIEVLRLYGCYFNGNIHEELLRFCCNMKRLVFRSNRFANHDWLLQKYPKLEHVCVWNYIQTPLFQLRISSNFS